jgi:hypothetical protein
MPTDPAALLLDTHGAKHLPGAATHLLPALEAALADLPRDRAGVRLHGIAALRPLLESGGPIGALVARELGTACVPVRAILFDKTPETNWALGWHQDRTIAVGARVETPGFGPWSVKQGMTHVEPPFALIETMRTLRVHLDPVPVDNAPLLIAPGSHRLGRIPEPDLADMVDRCGTAACLAEAGDVWIYATPIVHASAAATADRHRRVLQIDYSAQALPAGLSWLGI